jgi:hypothetical protein
MSFLFSKCRAYAGHMQGVCREGKGQWSKVKGQSESLTKYPTDGIANKTI